MPFSRFPDMGVTEAWEIFTGKAGKAGLSPQNNPITILKQVEEDLQKLPPGQIFLMMLKQYTVKRDIWVYLSDFINFLWKKRYDNIIIYFLGKVDKLPINNRPSIRNDLTVFGKEILEEAQQIKSYLQRTINLNKADHYQWIENLAISLAHYFGDYKYNRENDLCKFYRACGELAMILGAVAKLKDQT